MKKKNLFFLCFAFGIICVLCIIISCRQQVHSVPSESDHSAGTASTSSSEAQIAEDQPTSSEQTEEGIQNTPSEPPHFDPENQTQSEDQPPVDLPKICIDPGHYEGVNQITGEESYGYNEGDFTLEIALNLKRILLEKYGIESVLTRDTGTITLDGYSNEELDDSHLGLRGSYAAEQGCDFFISLHTNANLNNANGYPTLSQPIDITKTIVLANIPCCNSEKWLHVANEIGESMTKTNYAIGLSNDSEFMRGYVGMVSSWSDEWNDSLTMPGAVLCRLGERGDYYAILRAAAQDGVPGIIIEHGFHTVPQMRYMAAYENLAEIWAEADADGIAVGLGLIINS